MSELIVSILVKVVLSIILAISSGVVVNAIVKHHQERILPGKWFYSAWVITVTCWFISDYFGENANFWCTFVGGALIPLTLPLLKWLRHNADSKYASGTELAHILIISVSLTAVSLVFWVHPLASLMIFIFMCVFLLLLHFIFCFLTIKELKKEYASEEVQARLEEEKKRIKKEIKSIYSFGTLTNMLEESNNKLTLCGRECDLRYCGRYHHGSCKYNPKFIRNDGLHGCELEIFKREEVAQRIEDLSPDDI